MTGDLELPPRPKILVITLRRLGDVLLTTPLIRTLKAGLAGCSVDALVYRGTEAMLAGNLDLGAVITLSAQASAAEAVAVLRRIGHGYDLAVSTQSGDRPTLMARFAGRCCIGIVAPAEAGAWWKRRVLTRYLPVVPDTHRVVELLRLADCLGLPHRCDIICPATAQAAPIVSGRYAVLHANPLFRIRRWTDAGWRALAMALADRGLRVITTGGSDPAEEAYLDHLWQGADPAVMRLDGKLGWPELTALLRGAAVYVGPETSMTHLAAAVGAKTVALYGPASPTRMGPWPVGGLGQPWVRAGTVQQRGNVWVVQNPLPCMPCDKLGCEGHVDSYSRCLDELPVQRVLAVIDQALGQPATAH